MTIDNFQNKEDGGSVRTKLNNAIDRANDLNDRVGAASGAGIVAIDGLGASVRRSLLSGDGSVEITNGDGVSENPNVSVAGYVTSRVGQGAGIAAYDAQGNPLRRSVVSSDGSVEITNPDGVAGNPDLSITPVPEPTADHGSIQSFEGQWIFVPDMERRKLESATGGTCTIDYTIAGQPCYFHIIPKLRWEDLLPGQELGTGVHEAFLRDGVEKSELLIGMYQSHLIGGEEVSQPRRRPRRSTSYDDHRSASQAGGFDIMSVWEWSLIAFWCMANGYQPRGNTNNGQSHSHPHERGIINDIVDNIDTGTGPVSWRHNDHPNGISDLVGNIWEWLRDMKMVDGRIFLAADNDPSLAETAWLDTTWDMPIATATNWSGLYDAENEAPTSVRRALIMPNGAADPDGSLWTNLSEERFAFRGGARSGGDDAGLGALIINRERTNTIDSRGARLSRLV